VLSKTAALDMAVCDAIETLFKRNVINIHRFHKKSIDFYCLFSYVFPVLYTLLMPMITMPAIFTQCGYSSFNSPMPV